MLNKINNTKLKSPATGIIQRSNPKSFFVTMKLGSSELSKQIFNSSPKYNNIDVMVLQILQADDKWIIVELVNKSEF